MALYNKLFGLFLAFTIQSVHRAAAGIVRLLASAVNTNTTTPPDQSPPNDDDGGDVGSDDALTHAQDNERLQDQCENSRQNVEGRVSEFTQVIQDAVPPSFPQLPGAQEDVEPVEVVVGAEPEETAVGAPVVPEEGSIKNQLPIETSRQEERHDERNNMLSSENPSSARGRSRSPRPKRQPLPKFLRLGNHPAFNQADEEIQEEEVGSLRRRLQVVDILVSGRARGRDRNNRHEDSAGTKKPQAGQDHREHSPTEGDPFDEETDVEYAGRVAQNLLKIAIPTRRRRQLRSDRVRYRYRYSDDAQGSHVAHPGGLGRESPADLWSEDDRMQEGPSKVLDEKSAEQQAGAGKNKNELPPRQGIGTKDDGTGSDHSELYNPLPLDPNSDMIRVLEFTAESDEDNIKLIMSQTSLGDVKSGKETYDALSYCWGDQTKKTPIQVNNNQIDIGPSLHAALRAFQATHLGGKLWIDALCLNQEDPFEKSWQVTRMGDIYRCARTVRIFLGSADTQTPIDHLFEFLNRRTPSDHSRLEAGGCDTTERQSVGLEACMGLVELSRLSWWTRVWVIQEFYLAKAEPIWYWGSKSVSNACLKRDLDTLRLATYDILNKEPSLAALINKELSKPEFPPYHHPAFVIEIGRISRLIQRRLVTHGYESPVIRYRELFAGCQESQDLIYGLVSIFEPALGKIFVDDYQIAPELLWAALVVLLVEIYGWSDIFWWYPHRLVHGSKLPSWLPDLRQRAIPSEREIFPLQDTSNEVNSTKRRIMIKNWAMSVMAVQLGTVVGVLSLPADNDLAVMQRLRRFCELFNTSEEICGPAAALLSKQMLKLVTRNANSAISGEIPFLSQSKSLTVWTSKAPEDQLDDISISASCPKWIPVAAFVKRELLKGTPTSDLGDERHRLFINLALQNIVDIALFDLDNFERAADCILGVVDESSFEPESIEQTLERIWSSKTLSEKVQSHAVLFRQITLIFRMSEIIRSIIQRLKTVSKLLNDMSKGLGAIPLDDQPSADEPVRASLRDLRAAVEKFQCRDLFVTEKGWQGLSGPEVRGVQAGDTLLLADGLPFPLVVRPESLGPKQRRWRLVGHCLLDGVSVHPSRLIENATISVYIDVDTKEEHLIV